MKINLFNENNLLTKINYNEIIENIELLEDAEVKNFVGEYEPENYLLNPKQPMAVGPYAITDYYMEAKRNQAEGMKNAVGVVKEVAAEFAKLSGREYGLFEFLEKGPYELKMERNLIRYARTKYIGSDGNYHDFWPLGEQLKVEEINEIHQEIENNILDYVNKIRPNIIVLTGHDSYNKKGLHDLNNYKTTKDYIRAIIKIREKRNFI